MRLPARACLPGWNVPDQAWRQTVCFTGRMAMICPDCQQNLDNVPVGDPCPQCGGVRRSAVVQAQAAMVGVSAMALTVSIGYSRQRFRAPAWPERDDQRWELPLPVSITNNARAAINETTAHSGH